MGDKKVLKRFGFGKKQHTLKECFRDFEVVANTVQEFEALTCRYMFSFVVPLNKTNP